jgi:hypothetical protein
LVEDEMGVGSVSCHWVDGGHGHAPDRLWNGQGGASSCLLTVFVPDCLSSR